MNDEPRIRSADRALALAAGQIKLIRAVTPTNAESELASLEQTCAAGKLRQPRWHYEAVPIRPELCRALEDLARLLDGRSPLAAIYAARARELVLEAEIIGAVGSPRLCRLARRRFLGQSPAECEDDRRADQLAEAWTDGAGSASNTDAARARAGRGSVMRGLTPRITVGRRVRSCDASHPDSLFSRMSREAGRQRLPMRVLVQPGLASLAATGDGAILVAAGKWLDERDVERTVLHEIWGHAWPRALALGAPVGIFAIGTARGIDDQEGRALWLERAAGFLDADRRRELGLRHLAARATLDGATFADVVALLRRRDASVEAAVRIAARVQRGCHGVGGLAREIVYLPALIRVERAMAGRAARDVETMMGSGRIGVGVAPAVAAATGMSNAAAATGMSNAAAAPEARRA